MAMLVVALVIALCAPVRASSPSRVDILQPRDTIVAPYSFTPDQNWDGIDGSWSTFSLQIGTPPQTIRTILSWQGYQTWAVSWEGCVNALSSSACAQSRGGIFYRNESTSYVYEGLYSLYIEQNFGYQGNAYYGFDTVTLGVNGENGLSQKNTTVAAMAYNDFYLGVFGINPKSTNFTSLNDPVPSYMSLLKSNKKIPSVSFGFTQGAKYRYSTGQYASLTLGGFDSSKYTANNVTFNFNGDNDHEIMVVLQSISVPSTVASSPNAVELLPNAIYIEIDNTIPEIWLPIEACKAFEVEFGLIYDNTTQLYLVNNTLHDTLLARNANFTFTIGQQTSGGQNLNIILPYAAFDLTATQSYKGLSQDTRYFPLRRGQNSTQYVLGRTFMQEAYLVVDYEVSRFQLGQVVWDPNASQQLVAIPPADQAQSSSSWTSSTYQPSYSSNSGSGSGSGSGSRSFPLGTIIGIVVGVVVLLIAVAIGLFFFIKRRRQRKAAAATYPADNKGQEYTKAELMGSTPDNFGMTHHDMDRKALLLGSRDGYSPTSSGFVHTPGGESTISSAHSNVVFGKTANMGTINEAHSRAIYEMPGDMPNTEKDGRQFSEKEALQHRERIYNGVDEASEGTSSDGMSPVATGAREGRRVVPENIVNAETGDPLGRHRAFSFDLDPATRTNMTDSSGSTLVQHSPQDETHRPQGNFI